MGEDGSPRRGRLNPLPFFYDVSVCLVNDLAHFGERLAAPVAQFLDLRVEDGRGEFSGTGVFMYRSNSLEPNLFAINVTLQRPHA